MLPLRYARYWFFAGVFVLALVFAAALMPAMWFWSGPPVRVYLGFDKWLHLAVFAFLAVWFSGQYTRRAYWRIAAGLLLFGLVIEACQRMVSYRTGDLQDFAADAVGIVLGLAIAALGAGGWSVAVENWLGRLRQSD